MSRLKSAPLKGTRKSETSAVAARERKNLDDSSTDPFVRFALHLRRLLDKKKIGPTEFASQLNDVGVEVSVEAVKKWLSADRMPRAQDLEKIGQVLGLKDYRDVLPPPL